MGVQQRKRMWQRRPRRRKQSKDNKEKVGIQQPKGEETTRKKLCQVSQEFNKMRTKKHPWVFSGKYKVTDNLGQTIFSRLLGRL